MYVRNPYRSVVCGENRLGPLGGQAFASGKGRYRHIAQAVDTFCRNRPQVALSILIEAVDGIAGEAIGIAKAIYLVLINPQDPIVIGSNPKPAITVDE